MSIVGRTKPTTRIRNKLFKKKLLLILSFKTLKSLHSMLVRWIINQTSIRIFNMIWLIYGSRSFPRPCLTDDNGTRRGILPFKNPTILPCWKLPLLPYLARIPRQLADRISTEAAVHAPMHSVDDAEISTKGC